MRNPHQSLIPAVLVLAFAVGATLLLESSEAGDPQTRRAAAAAGFSGSLGRSVADQGNQALHQIRGESWARFLKGPQLPPRQTEEN